MGKIAPILHIYRIAEIWVKSKYFLCGIQEIPHYTRYGYES